MTHECACDHCDPRPELDNPPYDCAVEPAEEWRGQVILTIDGEDVTPLVGRRFAVGPNGWAEFLGRNDQNERHFCQRCCKGGHRRLSGCALCASIPEETIQDYGNYVCRTIRQGNVDLRWKHDGSPVLQPA